MKSSLQVRRGCTDSSRNSIFRLANVWEPPEEVGINWNWSEDLEAYSLSYNSESICISKIIDKLSNSKFQLEI
ncbi:hypothetical protein M0811_11054 [Anaeramoeba ignava]|uniref:Uncharacterized protein n=1 Tax=Anaeramoeba ignava TaxID=1746090 RepID=A0A9Q0LF64_ANAIG|nr:hypothetical protein M0811_11054 [Anaeramoeba ignava]